jgi:hypothetical protein
VCVCVCVGRKGGVPNVCRQGSAVHKRWRCAVQGADVEGVRLSAEAGIGREVRRDEVHAVQRVVLQPLHPWQLI